MGVIKKETKNCDLKQVLLPRGPFSFLFVTQFPGRALFFLKAMFLFASAI